MSFSPFAILTAEEVNDLVENIEAVASGTGIGDGAVTSNTLAQSAVTSDKLVEAFFRGRYQSDATNSAPTGLIVQYGWGSLRGPGNATNTTKAVTFPQPFSGIPVVIASYAGGSSSPIASLSDATTTGSNTSNRTGGASAITATGFNAVIADSATLSTSVYHAYTWIAIGPA